MVHEPLLTSPWIHQDIKMGKPVFNSSRKTLPVMVALLFICLIVATDLVHGHAILIASSRLVHWP